MNTSPLISVIVPTYNASPYLDQCLTSIEMQTYRHLEILCINDGSTDDSLSLMNKHAAHDGRIQVITKTNEGYGATCNRGIEAAQGAWIAIVEPDDWIEADMFSDMMRFAQTFPEGLDIIKTPYWRIWMPDTPEQHIFNCSYRRRIKPRSQPFAISCAAHLLAHHPSIWSALYRKDYLNAHAIRFRPYPGAGWADNPFLIESLCQTKRIGYWDTPYYCYREETPEKALAFARANPALPFKRWHDMADELERLGIDDQAIWRAHYSRGFTYLNGILEAIGFDDKDVQNLTKELFDRMDPQRVFADPEIPPSSKRLFAQVRRLEAPPLAHAWYLWGLCKQSCYFVRNTGLRNTWYIIKRYVKIRDSHAGKRSKA